jgi:hypothetical protein
MAQGNANTPSRTLPIRSPPRTPVAQSATQSLAPSPLGTPVGPSRARVEIRPSVMPSEPPRAPTQSREPTVPPPMVPQHPAYEQTIQGPTQYVQHQEYYPTFVQYELPPRHHVYSTKLPIEKIGQFQKAWKKENNWTGKPYDILADKTQIFVDLCRRLDIEESQYASVFPDILSERATMFYLHKIGPGQT